MTMLNKKQSNYQKERMREFMKGNTHGSGRRSDEFRAKLKEIASHRDMRLRLGMKSSKKHIKKTQETMKGWTSRLSAEAREQWIQKLRDASLQLWKDPLFRQKFSDARKGYKVTQEHKDAIGRASRRLRTDPI